MRISDWSSDVCSSDLRSLPPAASTGVSVSSSRRTCRCGAGSTGAASNSIGSATVGNADKGDILDIAPSIGVAVAVETPHFGLATPVAGKTGGYPDTPRTVLGPEGGTFGLWIGRAVVWEQGCR